MRAILDAGALIALDLGDRRVGAMLRVLHQQTTPIVTSGGVVAQVWRDGARQANLARALMGVDVRPVDATSGRAIGELLARTATADIVDAHVALLAAPGDRMLTSDADDIATLLQAGGVDATIITV